MLRPGKFSYKSLTFLPFAEHTLLWRLRAHSFTTPIRSIRRSLKKQCSSFTTT